MIYESPDRQRPAPGVDVHYLVIKYSNSWKVRRTWTDERGVHNQLLVEFHGDYEDLAMEMADRLKIRDLVAALKPTPTGVDDG